MSQVVQAKCPHCSNVLRIPAEWLARSMRCKFCKNVFQAREKSSASASVNVTSSAPAAKASTPVPVAKPASPILRGIPVAPPKQAQGNPFSLPAAQSVPVMPRQRQKGGGWLLVVMFFILFGVGAGGATLVVNKILTMPPPGPDAEATGKKDERASVQPVPPADVPKKDNEPKNPPVTPKEAPKDTPKDPPKVVVPPKEIVKTSPPVVEPPKKDPPKVEPPKKKEPPKVIVKKEPPKVDVKPPPPAPIAIELFPRRALLISVNNYLFYNGVNYGSDQGKGYPGSSTGVLRDRLSRPPLNFPATQVLELSDGIPEGKAVKANSTQKAVLEANIKSFAASSREQDRIVIFFAGHAVYLDGTKKAYLVPLDGNIQTPDSLLPLQWVYDELAQCKAQQKLLILDVFRYSPTRGFELPGTGEGDDGTMPDGFDKELLNPPAGVQVWSSCVKDQSAVELRSGSAFLQALLQSAPAVPETGPSEALPLKQLVPAVNQHLQELVGPFKRMQLSRLTGKDIEGAGKYDPKEMLPTALKLAAVPGLEPADIAQVDSILKELAFVPTVNDSPVGMRGLRAANLPAFDGKLLATYKRDVYSNIDDLRNRYKEGKEAFALIFPLRAAYFDAIAEMQKVENLTLRRELASPVDPKRKAAFAQEQEPLGKAIFSLEQALVQFKEAASKRDKETSKRWLANCDFMQARLQSRLVYLIEYNYQIGQIRADALPELKGGQKGWLIEPAKKVSVTEQKAKALFKETAKLWKEIQKEHKGTPWALIAQRESMIPLGLQWRAKD